MHLSFKQLLLSEQLLLAMNDRLSEYLRSGSALVLAARGRYLLASRQVTWDRGRPGLCADRTMGLEFPANRRNHLSPEESPLMLSEITVSPITSSVVASAVPSITGAAGMVDVGRLARIMKAIKNTGNLLCRIAVASAWQVDAFVDAQALLGLPIRAVFEDQDFLWRPRREGDLYEPDPFAAESPFQ